MALVEAFVIGLVVALAWALLRGILEYGLGLLVLAAVGGWAIGVVLWQVRPAPLLAAAIGLLAWVAGLLLTWLVAMAILPSSARTFLERLEATPFIEWLAPQFGPLEIVALVLLAGGAAYGARPRTSGRVREG